MVRTLGYRTGHGFLGMYVPKVGLERSGDSRDINDCRRTAGFRHRLSMFPQALDMERDRLAYFRYRFLPCGCGRNAARQIGDKGSIIGRRLLDDDGVPHPGSYSFVPDCFKILAHVPGGRSSPGLPAIVTVPGLTGCRYWRWLPRVRTNRQPSRSIRRIASRTLRTLQARHPSPSSFPRRGRPGGRGRVCRRGRP